MGNRSGRALGALSTAVVLMAVVAGIAAANRLNLGTSRFTMTWRSFAVPDGLHPEEEGNATELPICALTMSGSFHSSTIAKVLRQLIGYVNSAQLGPCSNGGQATLLTATLPWHLTYSEFSGVLPAITRVRLSLIGFAMSIHVPLLSTTCLIRTTELQPEHLDLQRESGGVLTGVRFDEAATIASRNTTGAWCQEFEGRGLSWQFAGTGTIEQGGGRTVTMTLI